MFRKGNAEGCRPCTPHFEEGNNALYWVAAKATDYNSPACRLGRFATPALQRRCRPPLSRHNAEHSIVHSVEHLMEHSMERPVPRHHRSPAQYTVLGAVCAVVLADLPSNVPSRVSSNVPSGVFHRRFHRPFDRMLPWLRMSHMGCCMSAYTPLHMSARTPACHDGKDHGNTGLDYIGHDYIGLLHSVWLRINTAGSML